MIIGEINLSNLEKLSGTRPWYKKYEGLPFLHLGLDSKTGIDCFNLCKLIFKEMLNIDIPYSTRNFCKDLDGDNWYNKIIDFPMETAASLKYGWERQSQINNRWSNVLQLFDLVLMKVDGSNYVNHCALVVDIQGKWKKLLHIMSTKQGSWVAPYGHMYESPMTEIVCRWVGIKDEKNI